MLQWTWKGRFLLEITNFISFRYMLRCEIADSSCGISIFNLFRNLYTVFQSGYTSLHSHQQCKKSSLFSTPSPMLIISNLFDNSYPSSVLWYFTVALIYISLMISDVQQFFMYLSFLKCKNMSDPSQKMDYVSIYTKEWEQIFANSNEKFLFVEKFHLLDFLSPY